MMGVTAVELFSPSHQFRIFYRTLIRKKSHLLASRRGGKVAVDQFWIVTGTSGRTATLPVVSVALT